MPNIILAATRFPVKFIAKNSYDGLEQSHSFTLDSLLAKRMFKAKSHRLNGKGYKINDHYYKVTIYIEEAQFDKAEKLFVSSIENNGDSEFFFEFNINNLYEGLAKDHKASTPLSLVIQDLDTYSVASLYNSETQENSSQVSINSNNLSASQSMQIRVPIDLSKFLIDRTGVNEENPGLPLIQGFESDLSLSSTYNTRQDYPSDTEFRRSVLFEIQPYKK